MIIRFLMITAALVLIVLMPFHFGLHQANRPKVLQLTLRELLLSALVVVVGVAWAVNASRLETERDLWRSRAQDLRRGTEGLWGGGFYVEWEDDGAVISEVAHEVPASFLERLISDSAAP